MATENKQMGELFAIALKLIECGMATPQTAFLMAIELERRHINGMLSALYASNSPSRRDLTGYDEVYFGIINQMAKDVYVKIRSK